MAVKAKKPLSQAVVGSTKKIKKSISFTKRMALFGIVGILAFSIVAGFGLQKWQVHQLKAKAAGWTQLSSGNGGVFIACKQYVNSGYGPLYLVKMYLVGGRTYAAGGVYFKRPPSNAVVNSFIIQAVPGQWTYRESYVSVYYNDFMEQSVGYGNGTVSGTHVNMGSITNC